MNDQEELNRQIQAAEEQIQRIKQKLMNIGDMRPGNLTEQFHPSKSPNHPYHQLSYTHKSRSYTEYIREAFLDDINRELREYDRFRELIAQWTDLAIAKATTRLTLLRATTPRARNRPTPTQDK